MALFNKLGELAKNVGDKTNELLETNRLSAKAKSEENSIAELKKELGQYFYEKYIGGEQLDEAAVEHCRNIQASEGLVAEIYAEIQNMKNDNAKPVVEERGICHNCGGEIHDGAKFCPGCGAKNDVQIKLFCPQCGAEITSETRFCSACGAKVKGE